MLQSVCLPYIHRYLHFAYVQYARFICLEIGAEQVSLCQPKVSYYPLRTKKFLSLINVEKQVSRSAFY